MMDGIPNERNVADGDVIKSSLRVSKERALEERIRFKEVNAPTRKHPRCTVIEKEITSMKKEIEDLRKSEEMAVLERIVNPSVAEGKTLISLVKQMNLFRKGKCDVLADETLESINTLTAKRQYTGKEKLSLSNSTRHLAHAKYVIELHKYGLELFKKGIRQPYNEYSRQMLKIFENNASQVTLYEQTYLKRNAERKMERKRRSDEKMNMNQFKRLSVLADEEIESRRERIDQTTFRPNKTW